MGTKRVTRTTRKRSMSEPIRKDAGPRPPALLVFTADPVRRESLAQALTETAALPGAEGAGAAKILETFDIDTISPASTAGEVIAALKAGHDGPPGHGLLIICADVAKTLAPKDLVAFRMAALWKDPGLAIAGAYETGDELGELNALGIERTVAYERVGKDLAQVAARAVSDVLSGLLSAKYAEAKRTPRPSVITVHANKGGVGKTTIAAEIAYGLSRSRPVAIADTVSSGGNLHSHFARFLNAPENGGYANLEALYAEKGLTRLARRLDHSEMEIVTAEHVRDSVVEFTDRKKPTWRMSYLPGIRSQEDYEVGSASPGAKAAQMLITKFKWAEQLIDRLRKLYAGEGYVVVDTDTTRYAQLTRVPIRMADLLVIVTDARDIGSLEEEALKLQSLLYDPVSALSAPIIVVVNQIAGKFEALYPGAPTLEDARRIFASLDTRGLPITVVGVRFDPGTTTGAGRFGLPVLAAAESDEPMVKADSPLVADLEELVALIASMQ